MRLTLRGTGAARIAIVRVVLIQIRASGHAARAGGEQLKAAVTAVTKTRMHHVGIERSVSSGINGMSRVLLVEGKRELGTGVLTFNYILAFKGYRHAVVLP